MIRPRPVRLAPAAALPWIMLGGSMTRAIARHLGRDPSVTLRFTGPARAAGWEADLLGGRRRRPVWAREISLVVDGSVVLEARTITALNDPACGVLKNLAGTPLAELLFTDARWQRECAPRALAVRTGGAAGAPRHGRACLWRRAGRTGGRLLVEEYFPAALLERSVAACERQSDHEQKVPHRA